MSGLCLKVQMGLHCFQNPKGRWGKAPLRNIISFCLGGCSSLCRCLSLLIVPGSNFSWSSDSAMASSNYWWKSGMTWLLVYPSGHAFSLCLSALHTEAQASSSILCGLPQLWLHHTSILAAHLVHKSHSLQLSSPWLSRHTQ